MQANGLAGPYVFETYGFVLAEVTRQAQALLEDGYKAGDRVGMMGINCPEYVKTMLAVSAGGMVGVPLYDTLGPDVIKYVINHSEMLVVFVGRSNLVTLLQALHGGQHCVKMVVVWGPGCTADAGTDELRGHPHHPGSWLSLPELDATQGVGAQRVQLVRWCDFYSRESSTHGSVLPPPIVGPTPDMLATIMYTSGTTGSPKGVMISHATLSAAVACEMDVLTNRAYGKVPLFEAGDAHISYLPLAHIYERAGLEAAIGIGAKVGFWQGDVAKLQDDCAALRPAAMVGVPRVWERVREGATRKLAARGPVSTAVFKFFYARKLARLRAGVPFAEASPFGDWLVFRKVSSAFGGKLKLVISGAAPLPTGVEEFIRTAMCCTALQGYGLTETCSATSLALPDRWDMVGTAGVVMRNTEFCVASIPEMGYNACGEAGQPIRGELCLRGPSIFSGYYKQRELTAEVMDPAGFFHTGDVVELQPSGAFKIIDRKKNIFKLAQGEYVSPEAIELVLKACPLVAQVWVHGDSFERRLVAVVVPDQASLMQWSLGVGLGGSFEEVCATDAARTHVLSQLKSTGKAGGLRGVQVVHCVHLEPKEWDPDSGVMTPTSKMKRHVLRKNYQQQVQAMYASISGLP
ncbi:MAG: hypothetical protein WDW36_000336 [Sanguina aurantia]